MRKFPKIILPGMLALLLILPLAAYAQPEELPARYDPKADGIRSGYLCLDAQGGYITGIAPGTTLAQLNTLSVPGDMHADTDIIGTGTKLTSAAAEQTLTAVITGDVNADAQVSITDMLMVKSHILGTELTDAAALAGDLNADGAVSISDFMLIKSHLLGISDIPVSQSSSREAIQILTPGATQRWNVAGAAYASDNAALVSVSPEGVLTAGAEEGTTYIYALDETGAVVSRTFVTVLEGGLQVSLEKEAYSVAIHQTVSVQAVLNHPVQADLLWETEHSEICTVSPQGELTGHAYGETQLRVTLPNGETAQAAVRVMPPITAMEVESKLYKVKPGGEKALLLKLMPADSGEEILWTSSDPEIATIDENGVATGITKGTVTVTATGKYSGLTASCQLKVCDVIQVAITFDDGPSSHTPKLLDYLQESGIKATFFLVGNRINSYKGTVKRIVNEGHELGYHSYSHKNHQSMSTDTIKSDFEKSSKLVEDLTGKTFTVWRAPGGNTSDRVLNAIDLPHIMWSVDTLDWKYRNVSRVYKAILKNADDGEIILLHDLHKTSVEGAIKAMKEMQAGDYEFLTVTELLSRNGTTPQNNTNYYKAPK